MSFYPKFWELKHTLAAPRMEEGCGRGCLIGTICRIATTVNNQRDRCDELTARLIATVSFIQK